MTRRFLMFAAVVGAGCGSSAPHVAAPVVVVPPPPVAPPKPVCVSTEDVAAISQATGDPAHVQFCVGPNPSQCYALDLGTGAVTHATPTAPATTDARVELGDAEVKVCTGDTCKPLPMKFPPGPPSAVVTADGKTAVVLLGDGVNNKAYAEIWDVTAAKKLTTIRYGAGDFRCGEAHVVGPSLFITAGNCAGPAARGTLYTLKGKKIAAVGGREFGTFGGAAVAVGGNNWAFLAENGNQIAVQDVVTGKLGKTYDVSAVWRKDGAPAPAPGDDSAIGNPGESTLIKLNDATIAMVAGSPANGTVTTVDLASGATKVTRASLCP